MVSWQRATPDDHPTEYRVYRKASDETHYTKVGTVGCTASWRPPFPDTSVTKADYTYYVTAWNQTTGEESGATSESGAVGSASDHAVQAFIPADVTVRTRMSRMAEHCFLPITRKAAWLPCTGLAWWRPV